MKEIWRHASQKSTNFSYVFEWSKFISGASKQIFVFATPSKFCAVATVYPLKIEKCYVNKEEKSDVKT